jgi:Lambda phage tail tape-measure protein (Tape_meas_lam_C)
MLDRVGSEHIPEASLMVACDLNTESGKGRDELCFAAKASGVEQQTLDMALQRFTRRVAEAAQGTGEAKDALAQMGIALRDQSGNLRRSENLLGDVADAFARIEDPAERVRLAFKLFDSEGVALVNLLRGGSDALEEMGERARDLGIVLDEALVRDAERARTELDTLSQVISANLTRAALEAAPVIADLSSWLADVAGKATEQAFANAFRGAEDALVGFISTGKLEFQGLADSILADPTRMTVRQTITAPIAGALQSAFAGGGLFGQFHEGGIAGTRPPAVRYADAALFERAPRYHGGGFAGSGLLPDEVPIIARRGELIVPPERVVPAEKTAREQRPITVVVNVTAADANSFRASQGQIAADMARAIDRASRNR